MSDKTPAVYAALSKARQMAATIGVKATEKGAGTTKGKTKEDTFGMLAKVLPNCGIEVIPGTVTIVSTEKSGNLTTAVILQDFYIVGTEDGSMITAGWGASGAGTGDKFMQIALGYSVKTFMLNLLGVVSESLDESEVYGQELLSEAQLKEFADAMLLVSNQKAAWVRIKPKFGTDNPKAFTTGQFYDLMDFVSEMPKLTDKLPQAAKDDFYAKATRDGFVPDEILKALNFSDDGLTYAQKVEMTDYIKILKEKA